MENSRNTDNSAPSPDELGYLLVRVSTALGAIPLEDATVYIRGNTPESSGVIYSLLSDRDGLTDKVALPTPPFSLSSSPSASQPFSTWNVEVLKEGYVPVLFQSVPVYPRILSVQPAALVPRAERAIHEEIYNESQEPRL